VHQADHDVYTVFSLWDTFRAEHPLLTILEPDRTTDFIKTFLLQYQQAGRLPVWELWGNETDCMIGYHSVSVIADAYLKGIRGFDAELALEAMTASADAR
jgi:putative alpha-1,2-mannosidase